MINPILGRYKRKNIEENDIPEKLVEVGWR